MLVRLTSQQNLQDSWKLDYKIELINCHSMKTICITHTPVQLHTLHATRPLVAVAYPTWVPVTVSHTPVQLHTLHATRPLVAVA